MKLIAPALTALLSLLTIAETAVAQPLLTISCDKPKGFNMRYGVPLHELAEAQQNHRPEPKPSLKGPTQDGYFETPNFVIDANQKNMTVVWTESPETVAARKSMKQKGLAQSWTAPAAVNATILSFDLLQISAVSVEPVLTTYAFFPNKGVAFFVEHYFDGGVTSVVQLATFSTCEFTWAKSQ
jgi:hypothetical protein